MKATDESDGIVAGDDDDIVESGRNLYVRNIAAATTSEEFCQLFEAFGFVESHKLMVDIKTGLPRGFGFVLFAKEEDARTAARELNGFSLYGQPLSVRFASNAVRTPGEATGRLFLRHLPASFNADDVRTLCKPFDVLEVSVHMEGGDLAALAYVTAATPEIARQIARKLNNSTQFLLVDAARPSNGPFPSPTDGGAAATSNLLGTVRANIASGPRPSPGKAYRPLQVKVLSVGQEFPPPRQPPRAPASTQVSHSSHGHHSHPSTTPHMSPLHSHPRPSSNSGGAHRDLRVHNPASAPLHHFQIAPSGPAPISSAFPLPTQPGWWQPAPAQFLYPAPAGVVPFAQPWPPAFGAPWPSPPHQQPATSFVAVPSIAVYPFNNAPHTLPSGFVFTAPPPTNMPPP